MVTFHNPPRRKRPSFGSPLPNRQVCSWQRWFILLFLLFRKHCIHGLLINPSLCTSGRPLQPAWVRLGLRSCFFSCQWVFIFLCFLSTASILQLASVWKHEDFLWPCFSSAYFWFPHSIWEGSCPTVPNTSLTSLSKCCLDKHYPGCHVW